MLEILLHIKKRLYLYVTLIFILALIAGQLWDFEHMNIMPISILAVFMMLYPMLTGMEIEKVKKAGRNYKLIITTLIFAYFIASLTAFFLSRTALVNYPDLALALVLVGAIPCSNMLIGWSGIADASVPDALVIAVAGLLLIPFISPLLIYISGGIFAEINLMQLIVILLLYILVPLFFGAFTRRTIIKKRGREYFMSIKKYLPGVSALGILLIVFFSVAKVSQKVLGEPQVFLLVLGTLVLYYIIQTALSVLAAKMLHLHYSQGMILILGATASSQAISLSLAATVFPSLTVFALSFKPIIQVFYIMLLIYGLGPWLRRFLGEKVKE
ncbi:arsenite efflux pump ACR3-like permease [Aciduliprofundum sp. MAR08-339]|uniref:arsenic resistance protein n=1 Tax=Aciduliprofundum sp. (strain MAR08-339) TaxID=673860 RepID=UPI0002A4CD99|nr:arsenite efflux pump ACR3-like permease [Aciduliprofundum sp. MAR08-339]